MTECCKKKSATLNYKCNYDNASLKTRRWNPLLKDDRGTARVLRCRAAARVNITIKTQTHTQRVSPAGTVTCLVTRLQEWSWIINHLIITLSLLRRDRHTSLSSSFIHLLQHFLFLSAGGAKHISLFLHIYCGIIPYIIIILQRPFFHNASLCVNTISPDLRFITVVASFLHFCTARTTQTLDVDSLTQLWTL